MKRSRSTAPIDPTPRSYAPAVTLLRRSEIDPATVGAQTPDSIQRWLLSEAIDHVDLLELFQNFALRLLAAGLGVERASLHIGTLHPQLFGYAWVWERSDAFCDEIQVSEAALLSDGYRRNPLFRVVEHGERIRTRLDDRDALAGSSLMRELAEKGMTEYAALPLNAGGTHHNASTVATAREGGFTTDQFAAIEWLMPLFALHVGRHIAERISRNIATTYLGDQAGSQVLDGSIKRGSGTGIDAVIWVSDLRGFTELADRVSETDLTLILNLYFDRLAGAVVAHGGDILKFIGDGLLAVFPFSDFESESAAAEAAIDAAYAALDGLRVLNADPEALPEVTGWRPLRTGIALHRGLVFFGNVGAPERLDFTVIGRAVNEASRVEGLCKSTGHDLLITSGVATLSTHRLREVGSHILRGVKDPMTLYTTF